MDNRRLLMATLLSAAILFLWTILFPPPPPVKSPDPVNAENAVATPEGSPTSAGTAAGSSTGDPAVAEAPNPKVFSLGEGVIAATEEKRLVLENERVRIEIRNRGAQIESVRLKTHKNAKGEPLDLVRDRGTDPFPLALVGEGGRSKALNDELFVAEQKDEGAFKVATFRYQGDKGTAEKIFRLDEQGFLEIGIRTAGLGKWGILLGPGVVDSNDEGGYGHAVVRSVGIRRGEEDEVHEAAETEEPQRIDIRSASWLSLEDNLFFAAYIPSEGQDFVSMRPVWVRAKAEPGQPRFLAAETAEEGLAKELLVIAEAEADVLVGKLYFGAKQYSYLSTLPYGLEHTVRWGFLSFLAKPLYLLLEWTHAKVVPNYGWAIVIVTFLIKLAFFPLTWKSQKAMTKMQELNPKMQAIRARYKTKLRDKQGKPNFEAQRQMNDEVMALYRTAGVNPASGCLPILLQMPVFFAFYTLLSLAVELRQAPWILWINDLSTYDPYYVLPLLMGVTSVIMQRMTPPPPDPMQAKLMQILPIVFTVFAFAFPSGLVVYWVTNNLLTMTQQWFILKGNKTASVPNAA